MDQKFRDEARGLGLLLFGIALFLDALWTMGPDPFGFSACIYNCGRGYLALVSLGLIGLGAYLAFRKPKAS